MNIISAVLVGVMVMCGMYLIFSRAFVRILFGFALLSHAANLTVLMLSGSPLEKHAPIIRDGITSYVDPLPQALILTAIVISFGVMAFMVALLFRLFSIHRTVDAKKMFEDDQ